MIGRAGALGVAATRKGRETNPIYQGRNGPILKIFNTVKTENKKVLEYYRVPYIIWTVGLIFVGVGSWLMYVANSNHGDPATFEEFQGKVWWQYLVAAFIIFVGVLFCFSASIEYTRFDRQTNRLILQKKNIFCRKEVIVRNLLYVTNISIVKRGINNLNNNTTHYKILIDFAGEKRLEILETKKRMKAKQRYLEIANLLGMEIHIDTIPLIDEMGMKEEDESRQDDRI